MKQFNPASIGETETESGLASSDIACHGKTASTKTTEQLMKEQGALPLPINAKHPYNRKLNIKGMAV